MLQNILVGLYILTVPIVNQELSVDNINSEAASDTITVKNSADFEISGKGTAKNWEIANWLIIPQRSTTGEQLLTKMKILYSDMGIYFLFSCEDKKISATMDADFMDLWKEDVVEVFLMPDENTPMYFEYEISPLNYELALLISNDKGDLVRWQPFHYDADRRTRHSTDIQGGEKRNNAAISGWTAEFFIPYKLLRPLTNISPKPGTTWKSNVYRVDYDNGRASWMWRPVTKSYHEYEKFGVLFFE